MSRRFVKCLTTFFYLGLVPYAPGTLGSAAGLFLALMLRRYYFWYIFVFVAITILGFFLGGRAERIFGQKDPSSVVIDEVSGIFVVFWGLSLSATGWGAGFLFYRFFDIVKPFPLRHLEKLPGSLGIMLDDLGAAVYAHVLLRFLFQLNLLH